MNKGLIGCIMFILGAAAGAGATYAYLRKKTEDEINEEVQKFKDDWNKTQAESLYFHELDEEELKKEKKIADEAKNKPDILNYTKMYEPGMYEKEMTIEDYMDKSGLIVDIPKNHPHVISEYEFTEDSEYEKSHYILYADGILADEDGKIVDNDEEGTENYIDPDVLYGFQMQDVTDELYYRNEEFERDFEILKSARLYNEG